MRLPRNLLQLAASALLIATAAAATAAEPLRVNPTDLHSARLRPGISTYLVYMHGAPGSGIKRTMLSTSEIKRERVGGQDAWVIEQRWEDETGVIHTARTVHGQRDLTTLAQTSTWTRAGKTYSTIIDAASGQGRIEGEMPDAAREKTEAGFATMRDGWWFNWHSDLALLPLLPFEKGGTLRLHLFDVGMPGPMDVDYTVIGSRQLPSADGITYDCWLVETESGSPGSGNYQRFWIDKQRRIVIKEEDVFNGMYRSKVQLSVPATVDFPLPPVKPATQG